jgi:radical SAM superfamily enzyme YgiQ (UPF0313 family)
MADIILTTLNARYAHCAFGLRYLMANLGELQPRARLLEFDINQRPDRRRRGDPAPRAEESSASACTSGTRRNRLQLVADLKRLRPDLTIILGGPEVSYECDQQEIVRLADHVITGEADFAFAELCREILQSPAPRPPRPHIIPAPLPDFDRFALPYELYTDDRHRAPRHLRRGVARLPVRMRVLPLVARCTRAQAPLEAFLAAMQRYARPRR